MTTLKHDYRVVYTPIEDGWIMASVPNSPERSLKAAIWLKRGQ